MESIKLSRKNRILDNKSQSTGDPEIDKQKV